MATVGFPFTPWGMWVQDKCDRIKGSVRWSMENVLSSILYTSITSPRVTGVPPISATSLSETSTMQAFALCLAKSSELVSSQNNVCQFPSVSFCDDGWNRNKMICAVSSPGFLGCKKWYSQLHAKIFAWWEKIFAALAYLSFLSKLIFHTNFDIVRILKNSTQSLRKNFVWWEKNFACCKNFQSRKTALVCQ